MHQELNKSRTVREDMEERHAREIADEVARLHDRIEQERKICEDNTEKIAKSLQEEVAKVDELLATEQKVSVCHYKLHLVQHMELNEDVI